jgi:alpha-glucosidase
LPSFKYQGNFLTGSVKCSLSNMNMENQELGPAEEPELPPKEISFDQADVSRRYDDVYQIITPDEIQSVRWKDGSYEFVCGNGVCLRVQVITPGIIRFRYSPEARFAADQSYAISPDFQAEKVLVTLRDQENEYVLLSEQLQVVVAKADLGVKIYDLDDHVLCEDAGGYSARRTIMSGWSDIQLQKKCHSKEYFYGLGDKTGGVQLNGKRWENWCTDSYAFGRDTDPLYRAIPVYYSLHQGMAYGIFLDNTFKSYFDFNTEKDGTVRFGAAGGELNYYFIAGPTLQKAVQAYTQLTGAHELPPIWALGYHQCRWSYYPENMVRDIANNFRLHQIPCDAIYLDIDYMDAYKCFTWNEGHFPAPKKLIDDLRAQGFQTVVMIDPGIKEDPSYFVYKEGLEQDMFLKTADGDVAKGPVWPGFCAFPDYSNPRVREWWGDLYTHLYQELGVSGFWNDMNEPAVFHVNHKTLPDHVMHHGDGHPCSHKKAHNVYGLLMSKASWDGFKKLQPLKRPFLLSRASFSGGQRYAAIWTGDNCSDWEHLQLANIQCQRLGVSGFSFCGSDVGGFAGNCDGELFVRWLQLAVFHPLMRVHSMGHHESGDAMPAEEAELIKPEYHHSDQEPWSFGEKWMDLAKKAIELRYCLLPCLYTAMWRLQQDGSPVLRHLVFADENDPRLFDHERDFLFAEHLLVSPVIQSKVQRQSVYLPKGNWFYFWTGQPASGEMFVNVMADQIPFFVREGAVLPIYPIRQSTTEKPVDELTLYVYYKNGQETSHLYEDAGENYEYQAGAYSLRVFTTEGDEAGFTLKQTQTGAYKTTYDKVKIYLVGFPSYVKNCSIDGVEAPIKEIKLRDRSLYTLLVGPHFEKIAWHV